MAISPLSTPQRLIGIFLITVFVCKAQVMDGDIRIVSDNPREGHVEVFLENEWGTISTIDFDEDTTTVICRKLGFHGPAETIKSTEHLGPLSSPEWNIKCPEGAESILDCDISKRGSIDIYSSYSSQLTTWNHDNDLGVICKELEEGLPSWMYLVFDVALSLLLFVFILVFAYLAYYFAKRGKTTPSTKLPPDSKSNPTYETYVTPIETTQHDYSEYALVEGKASEEAEVINMAIVEDKEGSTYANMS
ncbi:uncharacterized protein [Apostichopus japonicus]|uniref:uncharacterized protein isoform X6 n=1 Tax=Stichopus japonicus TaxID=307972 RepID=UPI003AB48FF0